MNTSIAQPLLIAGSLFLLQGCYTQLATYDDHETYGRYEQDEPAYNDTAEAVPEDTLAADDSSAVVDEWNEDARPPIGFDYYYPSWYSPVMIYDPWYVWDPWDCTYGYPWWWERRWYSWGGYVGWHYYYDRPWAYGGYGGTWYAPDGRSTTRTSGTRRSGTTTRRDYDGVRSMSVGGGSSAGSSTGRTSAGRTDVRAATPGTAGRNAASGTTSRTAPNTSRTRTSTDRRSPAPSRVWSLPELFGRSSGSSNSSGSSSTSSGSSSSGSSRGSERSSGRTESGSRPAPSYSPPASSPAPARSSAPAPSSGGESRSSGSTRSNGSSRSR